MVYLAGDRYVTWKLKPGGITTAFGEYWSKQPTSSPIPPISAPPTQKGERNESEKSKNQYIPNCNNGLIRVHRVHINQT